MRFGIWGMLNYPLIIPLLLKTTCTGFQAFGNCYDEDLNLSVGVLGCSIIGRATASE